MANDDVRYRVDSPYREGGGTGARRKRIGVRLLWEAALLASAAGVLALPDSRSIMVLEDQSLSWAAAIVGLLALSADLSLRAAVPNLAIGTLGYASAEYFLNYAQHDRTLTMACLITLLVTVVAGLAVAITVIGLHVPSWAASLALAMTLMAWLSHAPKTSLTNGWHEPPGHGIYVFSAFAAVAAIGGLLGLTRPVRSGLGVRARSNPAHRQRGFAAALTALALVASSGLAGVAGILFALSSVTPMSVRTGLSLTALAFGATLLGGTSISGRRGSVFGTIPAVVILVGLMRYCVARNWDFAPLAIDTAAGLAGLVVGRLIEVLLHGRGGSGPQGSDSVV